MSEFDEWKKFINSQVIIDTNSSFVYIGTLSEINNSFVVLTDVDVHDKNEGLSTKERYIMEAKKFGVKANREFVSIRHSMVVSISKLEDVIEY